MTFFRRIRRYTGFAMLLHWLVAAGIAFLFVHGFHMMRIPAAERLPDLNLHRSVGMVVFALVLVRFWWRMRHPPPHIPMPAFQASIAHYVHLLIYELLIINGIAGSIGWIASGDPIVFFGLPLAGARAASPGLDHLCVIVGLTTTRILIVMIVLHVLAVLKHEWFDKDRLLFRMLPGPAILLPLHPAEIVRRMRERRRRLREHRAARAKPQGEVARD